MAKGSHEAAEQEDRRVGAITVCVFETVSICRPGRTPVPIGALQQKIVLTLLVAHGPRSVSVDRIAEDLWGDDRPKQWLAAIRTLANSLRRAAGDRDFVHWTGRGYRLHRSPAAVRSDLDEMVSSISVARAALAGGRPREAEAAARRALGCYGGGPWTSDCWSWADLAADAYGLLGGALLAQEEYHRCLFELSRAPEELEWHDGVGACLARARRALAAGPALTAVPVTLGRDGARLRVAGTAVSSP